MEPSLCGFYTHANTQFRVNLWAREATDQRGCSTRVSTRLIITAVLGQVMKGLSSGLQLDQHLRLPSLIEALGEPQPEPGKGLFSDSTLFRSMEGLDRDWMHEWSAHCARTLCEQGHLQYTLSSGRTVRPAMVDGSCFGGHWASVGAYGGDDGTFPISLEPMSKRGKELSASRTLRREWFQSEDVPTPTHMLLDGLNLKKHDLRNWKSTGCHPVVKTTQENLHLIDAAKAVFHQDRDPFEYQTTDIARVYDSHQNKTYRMWMVTQMFWDGGAPYLTVGRLEVISHDGERELYWVITTDDELSAAELIELTRLRWRIENNVFKRLNERVGSKDGYLKNSSAKYALLQLWMLGWCMVQTFWLECETLLEPYNRWVKRSVHWFQALMNERELVLGRPPPD